MINKNHSQRLLLLILPIMTLFAAIRCLAEAGEQITLPLNQAKTDPLIDFTGAEDGSADRVTFGANGLRVQQAVDRRNGAAARKIGFKVLLPARGDFASRLDMQVNLLEEPVSGWGQGLVYSVMLDDQEQSVLQFGVLSAPGKGVRLRCERIGRHVKEPVSRYFEIPFSEGELEIRRVNQEAIFAVRQGGGDFQEVMRLDCSNADIRQVSVWCLRQKEGNTRTDFLFRNLVLEADDFFAFQKPASGRWLWWYALIAAQIAIVIGLLVRRHQVSTS